MCHVLVIEDDYFTAMELAAALHEVGASSVVCTAHEEEAVELARQRTPRLIVSDVHLTEGSGPSAVQRIVEEAGPITTAFFTAVPHRAPTYAHVVAAVSKDDAVSDLKPRLRQWLTAAKAA